MAQVAEVPGAAVGLCLALIAVTTVRIFASVVGALLALAAVSTTSITVATTVAGYVLQRPAGSADRQRRGALYGDHRMRSRDTVIMWVELATR